MCRDRRWLQTKRGTEDQVNANARTDVDPQRRPTSANNTSFNPFSTCLDAKCPLITLPASTGSVGPRHAPITRLSYHPIPGMSQNASAADMTDAEIITGSKSVTSVTMLVLEAKYLVGRMMPAARTWMPCTVEKGGEGV